MRTTKFLYLSVILILRPELTRAESSIKINNRHQACKMRQRSMNFTDQ
ncbi:hypothetical protein ROSINTL182_08476 [Roseburia intestinalis L1-82]|uniref:Uncharacterized protein n=1 Tax=Roseburia intestinalis L1-82 TaxID=536231 RepID=C7GEX4_9FIRM|nr:hypothetical protein ROSINTL182_08476 [Roseburia intestinalis L1-82]